MIYTLTPNPSIDCFVSVDKLNTGSLNRTKSQRITFGGKGINVSCVLAEFGVSNTALGFTSGFTGDEIKRECEKNGINTDFVDLNNGFTRINIKINDTAEETEINSDGPIITEDKLNELFSKIEKLKTGDYILLCGSTPKSVGNDIYSKISEIASKNGANIIADTDGTALLDILKYKPFFVKPNIDELKRLFNVEIEDSEQCVRYAKELIKRGAQNVIVSMGSLGAIMVTKHGDVFKADALKGKVLGTVGAGDSMVAGTLAEYEKSKDLKRAFLFGVAAGSACAFSEGLAKYELSEKLFNELLNTNS